MNELVATNQVDLAAALLRVRCSVCCTEVSLVGSRDAFQYLLERRGWRIGIKPLCPDCLKEQARRVISAL